MSDSSNASTVFVTGGAGYIGSHAVKALRAEGSVYWRCRESHPGYRGAAA